MQAHRYYPPFLFRDDQKVAFEENPARRERYSQDLFTEEALRFLEANRERPFFLYLPYCLPHADLDVPEDSLAEYRGKLGAETPYVERLAAGRERLYNDQPEPRAAYAAMVTRLDREVGRILAKLDELGIAGNTLVLFSSDNGATAEGGIDRDFFASTAGLRGGKRSLYEGGIRAPLLARWPGKIAGGTTSARICAAWDLLATCAELAGERAPEGTDSVSLAATLLGREGEETRAPLYWESKDPVWGSLQAVRFGDWKAVKSGANRREARLELFDLAQDPFESRDVAAEHPEVVSEAERLLAAAHVPHPRHPLTFDELQKTSGKAARSGKKAKRKAREER
jgi:arylsulfatase